jgi:hypothetical protein
MTNYVCVINENATFSKETNSDVRDDYNDVENEKCIEE